ncbi:hypothetical protein [Chromohalobacter japonicus]|uniref:hypothetical protein n=1 Tax=Chromohalobacter japonicus TaxID=223900 RepID=UPI001FF1202A|nr:hypothetical protein [Chromohalobacter japonicus]MCK0753547.1 hypothetical protein [Chromohalobacter japonicus]
MSGRRPIKSFPEIFRQQGREEGQVRVAHNLFPTDLSDEEVASISDLALERVAAIRREAER